MPVIVRSASTVAFNNSKRRLEHRQNQRKLYLKNDTEKAVYEEASDSLLKDIRHRIQEQERLRRQRNIKIGIIFSILVTIVFCYFMFFKSFDSDIFSISIFN
ncbi:hypothetical protein IMCC3317_43040 [Kordia antarctica]|uniref:Uncharacterized protein n=1 Tax=Kordia antarctica TaxID=1218801 RepID=A0A7L4ZTJ4_9FLAO|nr:hypothetical protein [Kordia antarctica]QHI38904.1 hypothetical protein IMCC3317_43040 [Kordia antarctica]